MPHPLIELFRIKEILKTKMANRKRPIPEDVVTGSTGEGSEQPKSKKKKKEPKPLDAKKFGGMTEEEVCKLVLPDHMKSDMDIIFVSSRACYLACVLHIICRLASTLDSILPTSATITAMPTITFVRHYAFAIIIAGVCVCFLFTNAYLLLSCRAMFV